MVVGVLAVIAVFTVVWTTFVLGHWIGHECQDCWLTRRRGLTQGEQSASERWEALKEILDP